MKITIEFHTPKLNQTKNIYANDWYIIGFKDSLQIDKDLFFKLLSENWKIIETQLLEQLNKEHEETQAEILGKILDKLFNK